jgi:hypothetical protein
MQENGKWLQPQLWRQKQEKNKLLKNEDFVLKGSNFFQLVARNLDTLILSHTFFLPFPPNTSPQILFF